MSLTFGPASVTHNPRGFRDIVNKYETPRKAADDLFGSSPRDHKKVVESVISGNPANSQTEIARIYDLYTQHQISLTQVSAGPLAPAPNVLTPAQDRAAQNYAS